MSNLPHPPLELPPGYVLVAELGRRNVLLCTRAGGTERVVLRIDDAGPAGAGDQRRAELGVLAAVEHAGLAPLIAHGSLSGGVSFVARAWVEGQDLEGWAAGRAEDAQAAREIGQLVARLCPALAHLHAAGFVHADLKPGNVIVRPDGEPVLTDFGLARARGASAQGAGGVSGTLFAIAPEVLLGGAPDARSDLFALGVLLHQLLVRHRPSAREFYARFPREDFFEAVQGSPAELPEWARDVVAALVSRDPEQRPASAAELGRTLAGRLGLPEVARALAREQEALRFPLRHGREGWFGTLERNLAEAEQVLVWVRVPEHEDPEAVAREIALVRAIAGGRVRRVDLTSGLAGLSDAAQLEGWAERVAAAAVDAWIVVALPAEGGGHAWRERALVTLARTLALHRSGTARLVVTSTHAGPRACHALDFPPVDEAAVERFLAERMPAEDAQRVHAFAGLLARAGQGAARRLQALLASARAAGWILAGETRAAGDAGLRLRPGHLPAQLALGAEATEMGALSPAARTLLAALHVCGGSAELGSAGELAGLAGAEVGAAAAELSRAHLVALRAGARAPLLEVRAAVPQDAVDETRWRALAVRRAQVLSARGAAPHTVLPLRYRAGSTSDADVVATAADLRDRGTPELALELCDAIQREARRGGPRPGAGVTGELALAWCALGDPERAETLVAELERGGGAGATPAAGVRALCERVRGRTAAARHEQERALEHYEHALALDPHDGGEALLGRVQLCYELRRDRELVELADSAQRAELLPRIGALVRTFAAMSRLRIGESEHARAVLAAELADAGLAQDAGRTAGLRVNLGTLERRAGDLPAALMHFEEAVAHLERAGVPTRLAEARALYAAALRDAGELRRAAPLFAAALAARVRLGDERGADAVRGMLGLLLAERGHARASLQELELAAASLRAAGREADAGLLAVKADEVRARLGAPRSVQKRGGEAQRALEGDPRVVLALARACALRGELAPALEHAQRAGVQGRALGLAAVQGEAALLARWLASVPHDLASATPTSLPMVGGGVRDLWQRDEELLALLARGPWTQADIEYAQRLADELEHLGRDDRAARLWLALAARGPTRELRHAANERAQRCLAPCCAGLAADEAAALRRCLLGLPDPWPEDLIARDPTQEEQEMELLSLLEINRRMLAQDDLAGLLGTIVEQALAVSGAQRGFLVLEEQGELRIDTAMDSRRGGLEDSEVELSGSVLKEALAGMQPLRISNAVDDPLLARAPSVIALELRSILCVPFLVEPGLRGVIYVDHRLREAAFDERAERMLRLLADQAGLAILQVRRLDEIRRLNRELNREKATVESDLRTARKALHTAGLPGPAGGLVGNSQSMRGVHHLLERAAPSLLPVLVCGASGTGKELAARALHDLGPRRSGPLVGENCAALPPSLIEAELFGAKRGAFTGADRDREGLFERAHGGTLFLDEIGELPLELQAKLLRVLETGMVRRIGDSRERKVDFRLVAATNRDLEREVSENRFRADLFYRLHGLRIDMPPLAARREDIPALVDHYLRMEAPPGQPPRAVSEGVLARLCRREWPGNVRELFNELARLCVMNPGPLDDPELVRPAGQEQSTAPASGTLRTLAELEREAIERALRETGGDKRRAAELLGISRAKIYQRLKEWGAAD